MQSSKYKIFGHGRGGIDISQNPQNPQNPQGRNVQPFQSTKKLDSPFEKPIQTPFDGYTSTAQTESPLAYSQVSDLNLELTRRLIKQQLNRFAADSETAKTKNDMNIMKTELRGMKEFLSQNFGANGIGKRDDQEFKKQILKDVDKLLEEYHDQTARNLREVIKKFDQNIKLDCTKKFLPLDFINDVEKQFLELEDRINLIQSKMDGNKKQRPSEDPVVIAEAFQLRLKKNERESESLKKTIVEVQALLNTVNETNSSLKTKQTEDDERVSQKIQQLKKGSADFQKEIKALSSNLEELKTKNQQLSKKIQQIQQNQSKSPEKIIYKQGSNQSSQVKQFLNSSKGLAVSGVYDPNTADQTQPYRQLFKSPLKETISHKDSTTSVQQTKPSVKEPEPVTLCYRIDKDNFLLDQDGNYILNQKGKEIQLSQEQILILRKSTLVKLRQ